MDSTSDPVAVPIERGCGTRQAGGLYWELGCGPIGKPPEFFLVDPPVLLPPGLVLTAIGSITIETGGVMNLMSHIGAENYPNPSDFFEEYRKFGVSWRIPKNLPFEKLTPKSRLLLTHARGWIDRLEDYGQWRCPQRLDTHLPSVWKPGDHPCAGGWWEDLVASTGDTADLSDPSDRGVARHMPSFSYCGRRTPLGINPPNHREAICFSLPCTRFVVIRGDDDDEENARTMRRVARSGLRVDEVEK